MVHILAGLASFETATTIAVATSPYDSEVIAFVVLYISSFVFICFVLYSCLHRCNFYLVYSGFVCESKPKEVR